MQVGDKTSIFGVIIGLGAAMSGAVFSAVFPNVPPAVGIALFWVGIFLVVLFALLTYDLHYLQRLPRWQRLLSHTLVWLLLFALVLWFYRAALAAGAGMLAPLVETKAFWFAAGLLAGSAIATPVVARSKRGGLTLHDECRGFFNAWLLPASESMTGVMRRVLCGMEKHGSEAVRGQIGLIQRSIIDEERATFAVLCNALSGRDRVSDTELQERIGKYYRTYQHTRTWIAKGLALTGLNPSKDAIYQEWLRQDLDLLREIRRLYGPSRYDVLRARVLGVGFGETITRDLLAAGSTNPPTATPPSPAPPG